jgi:hypothetical protein
VRGKYADTLLSQYENPSTVPQENNLTISENARLRYDHLLSQISFRVYRSSEWPSTLKLMRVWIVGVSDMAELDLSKGLDDEGVLVFSEPHDKSFLVYDNPEGYTLSTSAGNYILGGEGMMIESYAEFQVIAELSSGEMITVTDIVSGTNAINKIGDAPRDYHDIIRRGFHYTVNLRFQNTGIDASAKVTPWAPVEVGGETAWW